MNMSCQTLTIDWYYFEYLYPGDINNDVFFMFHIFVYYVPVFL